MQPTANTTASSRKRVLIAEDNEDISIIFSYALNQKFEVETAANGKEALAMIERDSPDLLVLDINMPYVSGIDVLHSLREHQTKHPMKIIVATGNAIAATDPIMEYADMTLVKPISPYQLARLAERLLA
ncbi:MAG: response regulator [Anaerolineae bacterium]|nr:response regulator [Anaerolineae bacterium]